MTVKGRRVRVSQGDEPGKHDGDRDGQGVYQSDKTEKPQDYGCGRHEKGEPPKQDDPKRGN
jgi:hypothetical protein